MKKILIPILILVLASSCAGPLWEGVPRGASEDTVTVTIIINDPLIEAYREWLNASN